MPAVTQGEPTAVASFESSRDLLFGVAYRVLGSATDAEDIVQEAWLRWDRVDHSRVADPRSFLVQVTTRLALDRLRWAKARREAYVGQWLPEPLPTGPATEEGAERADSVSMAMLVVMETLSPLERVVFVLREAFEFSFAEIAAVVGRSETAVRQLARRARSNVRARRPRFQQDREVRRRVTERFLAACLGGDLRALLDLLAPEVTLSIDGNGGRGVARNPVEGAAKVARLLVCGLRRVLRPADAAAGATGDVGSGSIVDVNGGPAALITAGGEPIAVIVVDVDSAGLVTRIWIIANQDKLGGVGAGRRPGRNRHIRAAAG
ncbi:sigma-70 family RNA polymerase sigma factor [Microbispora sp. SCL1-1]|uniref:RNA polymerase sigma factor SigJ n=1 Tax=Microbispora hainanensis TaxID=568844 RepID=A0ABZ1ST44_9ACTN|nr:MULTISPECIES: RNA polymerase sigma factor SigJ [Microbispora]NJP27342.1 RNA polymerase sigma factor SigJ [Microbispora sp. CL1-1]TQS11140.1 sigma-70 family RNA polymerase sigma factor [Microbispora sp. SCL1-1]